MTSKKGGVKESGDKCSGGNSFGCYHGKHDEGKRRPDIRCMNCRQRMGCSICCQIPRELLCLNCHDWANTIALNTHGHVVEDPEVRLNKAREMPWLYARD
jgi:hypothetical protein